MLALRTKWEYLIVDIEDKNIKKIANRHQLALQKLADKAVAELDMAINKALKVENKGG